MGHVIDFTNVSTEGLEASPVAEALAGLRANEARYYKTKFGHAFTVVAAPDAPDVLARVERILATERDITIASPALEVSDFEVGEPDARLHMSYVFYESGLAVNVMWSHDPSGKRAVGFKLSDGMEVPKELETTFKFARQKSKLAGVIRGSYFVIKGEY
ncbi:phage tail protein [Gordonia terrae]|uniref:phage tail protein n=1 Tax=Gordonia terrae TaxID=2055 RepID=UPI003F6B676D